MRFCLFKIFFKILTIRYFIILLHIVTDLNFASRCTRYHLEKKDKNIFKFIIQIFLKYKLSPQGPKKTRCKNIYRDATAIKTKNNL